MLVVIIYSIFSFIIPNEIKIDHQKQIRFQLKGVITGIALGIICIMTFALLDKGHWNIIMLGVFGAIASVVFGIIGLIGSKAYLEHLAFKQRKSP